MPQGAKTGACISAANLQQGCRSPTGRRLAAAPMYRAFATAPLFGPRPMLKFQQEACERDTLNARARRLPPKSGLLFAFSET